MEIISAHELCCSGSTTLIVPPLTTIEAQLLNDCERLGIPAVAGSKVFLSYISFIHVQGEFLAGLGWAGLIISCHRSDKREFSCS